ncbi:MAG: SDR family oxidoreductase [Bryobacterales bacterium]
MSSPASAEGQKLVLLAGATGYVGGRLNKALEAGGRRVRCMARKTEFLRPRVAASTEVVQGDVLDETSLRAALQGVGTAYYLIHSMGSGGDFREKDRQAAEGFAAAAHEAGVRRIIYLGGLGSDKDLSSHLASRQEVGRILRESAVPTIEFRASIIIGSGSLSFEMIRALVDKLPVMVTPRWVRVMAQPIAIEDIVAYLVAALDIDQHESAVFEIGGAERASYLDIMSEYARQRGLKRLMIPVPVLTPRLSSLWLGLVTPLYARIGRKLIDSLANETVVTDDLASRVFSIRPRGLREAIERALLHEDLEFDATRWSDAVSSLGEMPSWGGVKFGSRLIDSRSVHVPAAPEECFRTIQQIGGEAGWYWGDWLWRLRGFLDLLAGGAGMRRGRRHPLEISAGETVDFWRVEAVEPNRLLRLYAEMKLPGRAWLQFEVDPDASGSTIRQTALFDPRGFLGLLYWYTLYPVHGLIFSGMLNGIAAATQRRIQGQPKRKTT